MANLQAVGPASAYGAYPSMLPGLMSADHLTTNYGVVPTPLIASHKATRTDRLEV